MAKLKQSLAVLRQIPEHIRTNYPLFVEFIRAYYEFLEQSQQQDLESIHDIDTVLDDFVFKFKDEIAKNFPVEMLSDKRLVMKHLREFYLSRGSEESYKFLFRVLFGKEATVFYPGTEMLRVSDGRWQQDVSIFVLSASGEEINPTGKYIYITNSRGKKIRTYCETTVEYNPQIYEVFTQRDYINELNVGASVSLEDGTVLGTIVPCPSKLNIYKAGSGFKVGDIFALKTQIGRGCIVKVTKVGSLGEILKLQVIKFGLDYETKFYSYLSNTKNEAYEYIHPLKLASGSQHTDPYDITVAGSHTYQIDYIVSGGNPLVIVEIIRNDVLLYQHEFTYTTSTLSGSTYVTVNDLQVGDKLFVTGITSLASNPVPPVANPDDPTSPNYLNVNAPRTRYTEPTDGFVDYGWASKQTYFYYDAAIPVGDESYASDRFYAESGYVGDIVQQFYADTTQKQIDDTLAIIEVELGAVAKYPGYFAAANGFISDEMYIQDGNYYQAFSYVVKVEEELRRYSNIVKALVHPAGMKLFSEYNIYNELQLSYLQPKAFLTLQLPLYGRAPSNATSLDQGYAYADILDEFGNVIQNAYTVTIDEFGEVTITENIDAALVYSQQGKASLYNVKAITDIYSGTTDDISSKHVEKTITDAITERMVSIWTDPQGEGWGWNMIRNYDEEISKSIDKSMLTFDAETDTYYPDSVSTLDSSYGLDDAGNEVLTDAGKIAWVNFKNLSESILQPDAQEKDFTKPLADYITERYTSIDALNASGVSSGWTMIRNYDEVISKEYEKNLKVDNVSTSDSGYGLDINGNAVSSGNGKASLQANLAKSDSVNTNIDTQVKDVAKSILDYITERYTSFVALNIAGTSSGWTNISNYEETIYKLYEKNLTVDTISTSDSGYGLDEGGNPVSSGNGKASLQANLAKSDSVNTNIDAHVKHFTKALTEIINTLDTLSNATNKVFNDSTPTLADSYVLETFKNLVESQALSDLYNLITDKVFADVVNTISDTSSSATDKALVDVANALDALSNGTSKIFNDSTPTLVDAGTLENIKNFIDTQSLSDLCGYVTGKGFDDIATIVDILNTFVDKTLPNDNVATTDILSNGLSRIIPNDSISLTDFIDMIRVTFIEDFLSVIDSIIGNVIDKAINDTAPPLDTISNNIYKPLPGDSISLADAPSNNANKILSDNNVSTSDALLSRNLNKGFVDTTPSLDAISNNVYKPLPNDLISLADAPSNGANKILPNDPVSNSDALLSRDLNKGLPETINIVTNGRVRLNSYDSEEYFAFTQDYQNETVNYISIQ